MKTQSQQIARGFEILGYVLLIPALISLIFPVIFVFLGIASLRLEVIVFGLVPILVAAPGLVLLVGYFRHSRGRLDEKHIGALWISTIIYNGLLILPWFVYLGNDISNELDPSAYSYPIITAYVAAITLAYIGFRNRHDSWMS